MCGRQPLVALCPLQMRMQWQSLLWPLCLPACSSQLQFLQRLSSYPAQSCCLESCSHSRLFSTMASVATMASVLTILLAHKQLICCWDLTDGPISAMGCIYMSDHRHFSVMSMRLTSTLHTLPYSLLCFWYSQCPDSSHQTLHCWFPHLFWFWTICMEWSSPSSQTETFSGLIQV